MILFFQFSVSFKLICPTCKEMVILKIYNTGYQQGVVYLFHKFYRYINSSGRLVPLIFTKNENQNLRFKADDSKTHSILRLKGTPQIIKYFPKLRRERKEREIRNTIPEMTSYHWPIIFQKSFNRLTGHFIKQILKNFSDL